MTGRRPSGTNTNSQPGSSRDNAVDLTSPPRLPEHPRPHVPSRTFEELMASRPAPRYGGSGGSIRGSMIPPRRESDLVLPQWQPDSDVSKCPVCQTDFHFFYRKHHCRKCGRVVCAACSPHRITIPKQYVVQPPNMADGEQEPPSPISGGNYYRGLGGGEVVRVCNPCVPDPWTPDQAANEQSSPRPVGAGPDRGLSAIAERYWLPNSESAAEYRQNASQADTGTGRRVSINAFVQSEYERQRQRNLDHARALRDSMDAGRARSQSVQQQSSRQNPPPSFAIRDPRNYSRAPQPPPSSTRPQGHRNTHSGVSGAFSAMPPGQMPQPVPPPPQPNVHPRRDVREEDECPVCGMELPPGENVREAHIQECITLRFSSTPSSSSLPNPPASAPPPRTTSMSAARPPPTDASPPITADASTPAGSRPRATSYRPRGMAVYKATEKDCTNEEGEAQECVICFEEFQPGDEMGRMECLCKFHRLCIRQWWDTKGTGSCPTHQLHD